MIVTALLVAFPAWGQTFQPSPEGIEVGRWVVAPYFQSAFEYDDNIFRQAPGGIFGQGGVQQDSNATQTAGVAAYLPIRNSLLTLDVLVSKIDYNQNDFDEDITREFGVQWNMNLSTYDRVTVTERYVDSFSEIAGNEQLTTGTNEFVFNGEPYEYNTLSIEWAREVQRQHGYSVTLTREDFNYDDRTVTDNLFDFRGFEGQAEYRIPLPGTRWVLAQVRMRRFDNFRAQDATNNIVFDVGEPFRRELLEEYQIGSRGRLGERQSYVILIGLGKFDYDIVETRPFSDIVGTLRWQRQVGGVSSVDVLYRRRPLASNFDTYFVNEQIRVAFERQVGEFAFSGARLILGKNSYAEAIPLTATTADGQTVDCSNFLRRDDQIQLQPYINFNLHDRVGFQVQITGEDRTSNCALSEFDYLSASVGLTVGWF